MTEGQLSEEQKNMISQEIVKAVAEARNKGRITNDNGEIILGKLSGPQDPELIKFGAEIAERAVKTEVGESMKAVYFKRDAPADKQIAGSNQTITEFGFVLLNEKRIKTLEDEIKRQIKDDGYAPVSKNKIKIELGKTDLPFKDYIANEAVAKLKEIFTMPNFESEIKTENVEEIKGGSKKNKSHTYVEIKHIKQKPLQTYSQPTKAKNKILNPTKEEIDSARTYVDVIISENLERERKKSAVKCIEDELKKVKEKCEKGYEEDVIAARILAKSQKLREKNPAKKSNIDKGKERMIADARKHCDYNYNKMKEELESKLTSDKICEHLENRVQMIIPLEDKNKRYIEKNLNEILDEETILNEAKKIIPKAQYQHVIVKTGKISMTIECYKTKPAEEIQSELPKITDNANQKQQTIEQTGSEAEQPANVTEPGNNEIRTTELVIHEPAIATLMKKENQTPEAPEPATPIVQITPMIEKPAAKENSKPRQPAGLVTPTIDDNVSNEYQKLSENYKKLEQENNILEDIKVKLNNEVIRTTRERDDAYNKMHEQSNKIVSLDEEASRLKAELENKDKEYKTALENNVAIKGAQSEEAKKYKDSADAIAKERDALKEKIAAINKEANTYKTAYEKSAKLNTEQKNKISDLEKTIEELNKPKITEVVPEEKKDEAPIQPVQAPKVIEEKKTEKNIRSLSVYEQNKHYINNAVDKKALSLNICNNLSANLDYMNIKQRKGLLEYLIKLQNNQNVTGILSEEEQADLLGKYRKYAVDRIKK